ncbi:GNAT family N-acetyltransferase [Thermoflavimicrobium daqui]|uniref:GNAT family N-acetyltransferase n=1 Tax=Thermoflavimicrobium daqui TaxID=2137476 RepID=A0A364K132_9BACL|nr:GNAT family N-acetyltransferase [Thermoflavimicrobium daqui]RAL21402.1 GNAT family N-acetyltransferase [Thermoflavimicrobium daqui]
MHTKRVQNQKELDIVFQIRKEVFVDEQGVPLEHEIDEFENDAEHILVYDGNQPVGTGRVRVIENVAKLERICVLKTHRKHGLGKLIIQELEEIAKEKGISKAKLHGQTQAEGFYQKLGYKTNSDIFMEEGIPHIVMIKEIGN